MRTIRVGECVRDPIEPHWHYELINGWASGCGWYQLRVKDGPHAGKTIWLCEGEYLAEVSHDQYETFNSDEPHPDHPDDTPMGGSVVPDLDGMNFEELGIEVNDDVLEPPRPEYTWKGGE